MLVSLRHRPFFQGHNVPKLPLEGTDAPPESSVLWRGKIPYHLMHANHKSSDLIPVLCCVGPAF